MGGVCLSHKAEGMHSKICDLHTPSLVEVPCREKVLRLLVLSIRFIGYGSRQSPF